MGSSGKCAASTSAVLVVALAAVAGAGGCLGGPNVATDLELRRVVLYRNGVGYFERSGHVDGDRIRFQVLREQVGDFLSSLAVVSRRGGSVRGVSFPSLAEPEPPPPPPPCQGPPWECPPPPPPPPSNPRVDVSIEMDGDDHDVMVAYVVEAPVWRPTYRIVLDEDRAALLQGWAVIQNQSGEDWNDVRLTVTEGAPLTFRADLGTPYIPYRPIVTDYGEVVQAPVHGLVSVRDGRGAPPPPPPATPRGAPAGGYGEYEYLDASLGTAYGGPAGIEGNFESAEATSPGTPREPPPGIAAGGAGQSLALLALRAQEGGLTHYDADGTVTVPDDSSTLVAILNDPVDADDTLLYQPDGGVPDSRVHPFRVVRFKNDLGVTLERGPMAILGRSSFLGQGILDPLPPGAIAAIPYALERAVVVSVSAEEQPAEARLVKIVHGRVTVQRFTMRKTTYEAQNLGDSDRVLWVRHAVRSGYELQDVPEDAEDLGGGATLLRLAVPAAEPAKLEVVEKSPVTVEVELLTPLAREAIAAYLSGPAVDALAGPVLERAMDAGRRLDELETQRSGFEDERREIQRTLQELRSDLSVLGDNPRAADLRNRLTERLGEMTRRFEDLTTKIVEVASRIGEMRVELSEAIRALDLTVPAEED